MFYIYNQRYNQYATNELVNKNGQIISMPGEIFVHLLYYNMIALNYLISNFGRIYKISTEKFINQKPDKDGYLMASIKIEEKYFKIRVHRAEMMSFYPLESYDNMVCNHKDAIRNNNLLSNLEWTTPIENTRYGWNLGSNKNYGENHPLSVYTESQIRNICILIDKGLSNREIADRMKVTDKLHRCRLLSTISSIRNGKIHRHISSQYDFMNANNFVQYSNEFAYLVCNILSDGNVYTYKEIADLLQIQQNERIGFAKFINDLINGKTAKDVTRQFANLKRPLREKTDYDYLY